MYGRNEAGSSEAVAIVQTTVASEADAARLADALIEARLAACVQIVRIESRYRWQGAVEVAAEWRLDAKTLPALASALAEKVLSIHPYDTPEVLTLPAVAAPGYLDWVRDEVGAAVSE